MTKPKTSPKKPELRDPTAGEIDAMRLAKERRAARPSRVSLKGMEKEGVVVKIQNPHSDGDGWHEHLTAAFGTRSDQFASWGLLRLTTAGANKGQLNELAANAALAIMEAVAPQDELEAAIGLQIIACNEASLDFLSRARLNAGEYVDTAAAYTNMATKASRTMAVHLEALTKLRSGGKQQVIVKHVYVQGNAVVGDGAQAVFGAVETGVAGGFDGKPDQPLALASVADVGVMPMRSEDEEREAVPRASDPRPEAMSDARRK